VIVSDGRRVIRREADPIDSDTTGPGGFGDSFLRIKESTEVFRK
jgi:hypothetical protein